MRSYHHSQHKLLFSSCAVLLICFAFTNPAFTQRRRKSVARISEKQKRAEAAADRVMARFYQTMDFGVIYSELFVSDPLKRREVEITIGHFLMQHTEDQQVPPIDFASLERAYIAERNFDFLSSAVGATCEVDPESLDKELVFNVEQYYMPIISPTNGPVLTAEQLDTRFTANFEHLCAFLRRYVLMRNYGTALYRKRLASFQQTRPPEMAYIRSYAGQEVYVVQRERLHLYFVEQNGKFRMLSTTTRVMS